MYGANGNVTQKIATPEIGNYTYDVLDPLASDNNGTNTTFGYDAQPLLLIRLGQLHRQRIQRIFFGTGDLCGECGGARGWQLGA
jgi:hypothetical protein